MSIGAGSGGIGRFREDGRTCGMPAGALATSAHISLWRRPSQHTRTYVARSQ